MKLIGHEIAYTKQKRIYNNNKSCNGIGYSHVVRTMI